MYPLFLVVGGRTSDWLGIGRQKKEVDEAHDCDQQPGNYERHSPINVDVIASYQRAEDIANGRVRVPYPKYQTCNNVLMTSLRVKTYLVKWTYLFFLRQTNCQLLWLRRANLLTGRNQLASKNKKHHQSVQWINKSLVRTRTRLGFKQTALNSLKPSSPSPIPRHRSRAIVTVPKWWNSTQRCEYSASTLIRTSTLVSPRPTYRTPGSNASWPVRQ